MVAPGSSTATELLPSKSVTSYRCGGNKPTRRDAEKEAHSPGRGGGGGTRYRVKRTKTLQSHAINIATGTSAKKQNRYPAFSTKLLLILLLYVYINISPATQRRGFRCTAKTCRDKNVHPSPLLPIIQKRSVFCGGETRYDPSPPHHIAVARPRPAFFIIACRGGPCHVQQKKVGTFALQRYAEGDARR